MPTGSQWIQQAILVNLKTGNHTKLKAPREDSCQAQSARWLLQDKALHAVLVFGRADSLTTLHEDKKIVVVRADMAAITRFKMTDGGWGNDSLLVGCSALLWLNKYCRLERVSPVDGSILCNIQWPDALSLPALSEGAFGMGAHWRTMTSSDGPQTGSTLPWF